MSAGIPGNSSPAYIPGLTAGGNLSSQIYKAVKFASTANAVIAVAATTDVSIGFLANAPTAGQPALVQNQGVAVAISGVTDLNYGENVGYNTTGQVVDHVTDNRMSSGRSIDTSTAVGDYVRIALYGGGSQRY